MKNGKNVAEKTGGWSRRAEDEVGPLCSGEADEPLCPVVRESGVSWNDDQRMSDCGACTGYKGLDVQY